MYNTVIRKPLEITMGVFQILISYKKGEIYLRAKIKKNKKRKDEYSIVM